MIHNPKQHTTKMEEKYATEITICTDNTITYTPDSKFMFIPDANANKAGEITVISSDSVTAIFEEDKGRTAILNFANFYYPGGGYMAGSKAQEECLCMESFLYNVLYRFTDTFYRENKAYSNDELYMNRALYSPAVIFERDDLINTCDVITCAAPCKSAATLRDVSDMENLHALKSRIRFIIDMAIDNQVDTLVLGAFGCGVFGQNPEETAKCFKEVLETSVGDKKIANYFEKIVFAIYCPPMHTENYDKFLEVLG